MERPDPRIFAVAVACLAAANAALGADANTRAEIPSAAPPETVIDLLVAAQWHALQIEPAPRCDDAMFARRVYLDLAGRIPTSAEFSAFLAETASDKRTQLVDRLLASDEFARHMGEVFDVVLMGRNGRAAQQLRRRHGWSDYLQEVFARNRPWNQVVRELLIARVEEDSDPASAWFLYERKNAHQDIAEAVAARLFGVRVDCAQCHDHPSVVEIEQEHYWALVKFFKRSHNVDTKSGPRVAESAVGGYVQFTDLGGESAHARLTFLGTGHIVDEPPDPDGDKEPDADEYYVTADGGEPRVPTRSRRQLLADEIVAGNPLVARAMVNRLWALLIGRGMVHPVDEMDSEHPASHPKLLDWLAADFERSGYDIARLVRAIALSRPYQLDSRPPPGVADPQTFAWALEKPLTAEAYYRSMLIAVDDSLDHAESDQLAQFRRYFAEVMPTESVTDVSQTMFLSNHATMEEIVAPRPGGVLERILELDRPEEQVRAAMRAAFHREPGPEELSRGVSFLAAGDHVSSARPPRRSGVRQLMWALLTSSEFRFNH